MPWLFRVSVCVLALQVVGCSVVGIRTTEEAPYRLLEQDGQVELRQYGSYVVAETTVQAEFEEAGDIGFRRLFNYISGDNQSTAKIAMTAPVTAKDGGEKIAMTAPVTSQEAEDGWVYAFVLPKGYTLENAPAPTNKAVTLAEVPAQKQAAIRFSGYWNEATAEAHEAKLRAWIASRDLTAAGDATVAGYDPPWTLPWFRRNEVLIPVE